MFRPIVMKRLSRTSAVLSNALSKSIKAHQFTKQIGCHAISKAFRHHEILLRSVAEPIVFFADRRLDDRETEAAPGRYPLRPQSSPRGKRGGNRPATRRLREPSRRIGGARNQPAPRFRGAGWSLPVHRVPDDDLLRRVVAGRRGDVAVDGPELGRRERDRDVFLAGALRDPVPTRAELEAVLAGDDEVVGGACPSPCGRWGGSRSGR